MKPEELKASREALGLPLQWCADHVGRVSLRTWHYWEKGREGRTVTIPADVSESMRKLSKALEPWL